MTIIIRLQGLDVKAGAEDIRNFFEHLHIPDGGVYIVGGRLGEAFIAFTSERDAQLAMRHTGNFLKGSKVTLHISSMAEMEHRLRSLLRKEKPSPTQVTLTKPQPSSEAHLPSLNARHPHHNTADRPPNQNTSDDLKTPGLTENSKPGYVRLFGLPSSATKEDICHFFRGLTVQEAIVNVKLGLRRGCLVKFANIQDACDALHFNQQLLGTIYVEVRTASEKMWTSALKTINHSQKSTMHTKKRSGNKLPSKPKKKTRLDCDSAAFSPSMEYIVMVRNLPRKMTKTEIKELFGCPNVKGKNVLHLLDKRGNRTDKAFLIFDHIEDYNYAVSLTGCHVASDVIEVSSITKEMMMDMMAKTYPRNSQTCLFVRNMPAGVQRSQIKRLFHKYKVGEDNITLLHDSDGKGTGEAVVQFKSEKLTALAQRLHGKDFLGEQVLLSRINVKQMEGILSSSH
uniref:RRM domain-containing protein n=1 Tax=Monopterus albus TaxID=43700 RepID=A0A3Q3Q0M2_MONAL